MTSFIIFIIYILEIGWLSYLKIMQNFDQKYLKVKTELKKILVSNFSLLVITPLKDNGITNIEWTSANSSDGIPNLAINFQGL